MTQTEERQALRDAVKTLKTLYLLSDKMSNYYIWKCTMNYCYWTTAHFAQH